MKKRANSLLNQISQRIERKTGNVVLRKDFADLADYDQVGRSLRMLVRQGKLIKMGQGIYTRAIISPIDNKPALRRSLNSLALEAMKRLNIPTGETQAERAYNAGQTTQVPTGRVIGVRKRVRRNIQVNGYSLGFERAA